MVRRIGNTDVRRWTARQQLPIAGSIGSRRGLDPPRCALMQDRKTRLHAAAGLGPRRRYDPMGQRRLRRAHGDGTQRRLGRYDPAQRYQEHRSQGRRHSGLLLQISPEHDWSGDGRQIMRSKSRGSQKGSSAYVYRKLRFGRIGGVARRQAHGIRCARPVERDAIAVRPCSKNDVSGCERHWFRLGRGFVHRHHRCLHRKLATSPTRHSSRLRHHHRHHQRHDRRYHPADHS
jgi:hypothetical protein